MFEKLLNQLGLGEKEQIVYKLILEHGKIAPARIARLAGIQRTTVYSVGNELKGKGLVVEDLGGKVLYYLPARQEELEKVIKREHEKTEQREKTLRELQEVLKSVPESKTYAVPKVRYVDELDLKDYLYEATPRWNESAISNNELTWWGFQDHTFVEHFKDWIVWFWKHAPEKIDLKLFSNDSTIETNMQEEKIHRRQIRFWGEKKGGKENNEKESKDSIQNNTQDDLQNKLDNKNTQQSHFTGTQWIVGSYIISIVTSTKPYYLVEIHDAVLAHNMREVFKKLWQEPPAPVGAVPPLKKEELFLS